ncbi:hypothetical protein F5B22DRAFT_652318 [Xylaria bambusicola]|uniref:uncharacterized protein n=1 Tax=Xylaria bambusicola TaxID=326684 RepID=UPI0020079ECA|nr:uncharacterized protein F5B22DRAFT_652318 [Xylaria bambusicola]KAI0503172.1 hypothetical protein F5B22DRAFT_652318 [Xylaria bambusicola]
MYPPGSTSRQLALLGGLPAFPVNYPVPLIYLGGYRPKGDFSAVHGILSSTGNEDSKKRASQQLYVAKILPGVETPGLSFRATLQDRIKHFLELGPETSVICVTSGFDALRVVLRSIEARDGFLFSFIKFKE